MIEVMTVMIMIIVMLMMMIVEHSNFKMAYTHEAAKSSSKT